MLQKPVHDDSIIMKQAGELALLEVFV